MPQEQHELDFRRSGKLGGYFCSVGSATRGYDMILIVEHTYHVCAATFAATATATATTAVILLLLRKTWSIISLTAAAAASAASAVDPPIVICL